jgi:hypothetical protein
MVLQQGGFNIYDNSQLGKTTGAKDSKIGIHFTDNKDLAEQFKNFVSDRARMEAKEEIDKKYGLDFGIWPPDMIAKLNKEMNELAEKKVQENGEVKSQYLDMKKPFSITADYGISEQQLADDLVYALTGETDASEVNDMFENNLDFLQSIQYGVENELGEMKDELSRPDSISRLKERGYDGLILPIQKTDTLGLAQLNLNTKGNEYIVFNSNQAKNIDNTNPTNNPDIRYSISENTQVDNEGNKVSPGMQEYMKDSYARENDSLDGALKHLYHRNGNRQVYDI